MKLRMKAKKWDGMMEVYSRMVMDEKWGRNRGYPNRFPSTKMVNLIRKRKNWKNQMGKGEF